MLGIFHACYFGNHLDFYYHILYIILSRAHPVFNLTLGARKDDGENRRCKHPFAYNFVLKCVYLVYLEHTFSDQPLWGGTVTNHPLCSFVSFIACFAQYRRRYDKRMVWPFLIDTIQFTIYGYKNVRQLLTRFNNDCNNAAAGALFSKEPISCSLKAFRRMRYFADNEHVQIL